VLCLERVPNTTVMCCAGSPLPKGRLTATAMCKYSTYKGAPNRAGLKGRGPGEIVTGGPS